MRKSTTHENMIQAAERRVVALDMRKGGHSLRDIGREIGVTHQAVSKMLHKELSELAELAQRDAALLRDIELERLDVMQRALWTDAQNGDQGAIDRTLRIMERRSKLLGLDMPVRAQVETTVSTSEVHVHLMDNGRYPAIDED